MNVRLIWRRLRRGYEFDGQRDRRRYLERLAAIQPAPAPGAYVGARVDTVCLCGHPRAGHLLVSAGQATCTEACTCIIFRPYRVQVTPAA